MKLQLSDLFTHFCCTLGRAEMNVSRQAALEASAVVFNATSLTSAILLLSRKWKWSVEKEVFHLPSSSLSCMHVDDPTRLHLFRCQWWILADCMICRFGRFVAYCKLETARPQKTELSPISCSCAASSAWVLTFQRLNFRFYPSSLLKTQPHVWCGVIWGCCVHVPSIELADPIVRQPHFCI